MDGEHLWDYTTKRPVPTRVNYYDVDLPVGHRYGIKKRRTRFNPKRQGFQFYCNCGWKTDRWWSTRQRAYWSAERKHTAIVRYQGQLWEET